MTNLGIHWQIMPSLPVFGGVRSPDRQGWFIPFGLDQYQNGGSVHPGSAPSPQNRGLGA